MLNKLSRQTTLCHKLARIQLGSKYNSQNQYNNYQPLRQFGSAPQKKDAKPEFIRFGSGKITTHVEQKSQYKGSQFDIGLHTEFKEFIQDDGHIDVKKKYIREFENNSEWTRLEYYTNKLGFNIENFIFYCADIRFLRGEEFGFKTTQFLRRNYASIKYGVKHVAHEIYNVGQGFKRLKKDIKYAVKATYSQNQPQNKYIKVSAVEKARIRQIKKDVIKFIPFSFFLLIPGAEILLPPFLVVFPDSVPSQFQSEDTRLKKFQAISKRRNNAALKLDYMFPVYLKAIEQDKDKLEGDTEAIQNLQDYIRNSYKPESLPTDLLQYKELFRRYADFRYFGVEGLEKIAHFLGITPVTGVNVINNVLSVTGKEISITAPGVKHMAKFLMVRELNMYMNRIRNYDKMLTYDSLDKLSEDELDMACFRRGIPLDGRTLKEKKDDMKHWLSISNVGNVPNSLLIYTRIHDTVSRQYKIEDFDENLDEDQLEKNKLFEKTYGVNKLVDQTKMLGNKIGDIDQYDPINHQFLIKEKDTHLTMGQVSEFQHRNDKVSESISTTHTMMSILLLSIEKKTIIEHCLTGRQEELYKQYPLMKKQAQKLLGNALFISMQRYPAGVTMSSDDPVFYDLATIERQIKIDIRREYEQYKIIRYLQDITCTSEDDVTEEITDEVEMIGSGRHLKVPELMIKKKSENQLNKEKIENASESDNDEDNMRKMAA